MPSTVRKRGSGYVIMRHGKVVGHSRSRRKALASARIADTAAHGGRRRTAKPRRHAR